MTYVLMPSVLLGRAAWAPVAGVLRASGAAVVVADTDGAADPREVSSAYVDAATSRRDVVLVPHSNAGYFAPTVAAATRASAVVYVDAALPASSGSTPLAPPWLLERLAGLTDDTGLLPPWTSWWDDTSRLFPDDAARRRVEETEPRLPLTYFEAGVTAPPGWETRPQSYLAFGDTYADEAARAVALGWPTRRIAGGHLHLLHDPPSVAADIIALHRALAD